MKLLLPVSVNLAQNRSNMFFKQTIPTISGEWYEIYTSLGRAFENNIITMQKDSLKWKNKACTNKRKFIIFNTRVGYGRNWR